MLSNNNKDKGVCPYVAPDFRIEETKEIKYDEIGNIKAVIDKEKYESNIKKQEKEAFWQVFKKICIYVALFGLASAIVGYILSLL